MRTVSVNNSTLVFLQARQPLAWGRISRAGVLHRHWLGGLHGTVAPSARPTMGKYGSRCFD